MELCGTEFDSLPSTRGAEDPVQAVSCAEPMRTMLVTELTRFLTLLRAAKANGECLRPAGMLKRVVAEAVALGLYGLQDGDVQCACGDTATNECTLRSIVLYQLHYEEDPPAFLWDEEFAADVGIAQPGTDAFKNFDLEDAYSCVTPMRGIPSTTAAKGNGCSNVCSSPTMQAHTPVMSGSPGFIPSPVRMASPSRDFQQNPIVFKLCLPASVHNYEFGRCKLPAEYAPHLLKSVRSPLESTIAELHAYASRRFDIQGDFMLAKEGIRLQGNDSLREAELCDGTIIDVLLL